MSGTGAGQAGLIGLGQTTALGPEVVHDAEMPAVAATGASATAADDTEAGKDRQARLTYWLVVAAIIGEASAIVLLALR